MALSYRTLNGFPHLPYYERAAEWEAKVIPIRGRSPEVKPLGRRNQSHHAISRDAAGVITISRGRDPLFAYRPDGSILVHGPRWSQKAVECEIIGEVLGFITKSEHNQIWVECIADGVSGWYPLRKGIENIFTRAAHSLPTFVNPNFLTTHVINRAGMKEVRRRYKPFLAYTTAMLKLRREETTPGQRNFDRNTISEDEYGEIFGWNERGPGTRWAKMPNAPGSWAFSLFDAQQLAALMLSDVPADQYRAFLWLLPHRVLISPNAAKAVVEKVLLKAHPEEVLLPRMHKDGKRRKDAYAWASKSV